MLGCAILWFIINHNAYFRLLPVSDIHISQGSVATYLRCGRIFKYEFVANLPVSLSVKEFWKSVNIWGSYGQKFSVLFFLRHSVETTNSIPGPNPAHVHTNPKLFSAFAHMIHCYFKPTLEWCMHVMIQKILDVIHFLHFAPADRWISYLHTVLFCRVASHMLHQLMHVVQLSRHLIT